MDMYGRHLMLAPISGRMPPMAIGRIVIMDGHGHPITAGDGRLSIMAGGFMTIITVGCGCRGMSGRQPGLPGAVMATIIAGPRLHHVSIRTLLIMAAGHPLPI